MNNLPPKTYRLKSDSGFTLTPKNRCDLRKQGGFTLIELMIASGLFIILISIATGAFINTLRTQRIITDLSESLNNTSFAIEQIAREVRVGFNIGGGGDSIDFINSSGNSVSYALVDNGIERCESESSNNTSFTSGDCEMITAPGVNIDRMEFILQGNEAGDNEPPRVTIFMSVVGEKNIRVDMQTTISSRILDS